jgi:hypothetical protein
MTSNRTATLIYIAARIRVKTKLFIIINQKSKGKLSITIENFKIPQVKEALELPKVWLKS